LLEPEVGEHRGLIDVTSDLFGAPLSCDVLSARQLRTPTAAREADQVLGHQRDCPPRTLLPRRVRRRVDDDLTHDSPPCVVGIAARNEKPGECVRHSQ